MAAAIPGFDLPAFLYFAGAVLPVAATRSIDHLICGPLPLLAATPAGKPSGTGGWLLFATGFAGAAALGMWVGEQHGYWIVITTLVVIQTGPSVSYRRIVERVLGTLAGVALAWAIMAAFHGPAPICAAILIVAPLIPHHLTWRYWLHTGLIALMVLLAYDLTQFNSQGLGRLPLERMEDILLGCAIALVGSAVAFPRAVAARVAGGFGSNSGNMS